MQSLYTIIYCVYRFLLLLVILLLPCVAFKSAVFRLAFLIVQTNKKKKKETEFKSELHTKALDMRRSWKETPTTTRRK